MTDCLLAFKRAPLDALDILLDDIFVLTFPLQISSLFQPLPPPPPLSHLSQSLPLLDTLTDSRERGREGKRVSLAS